MQGQQQYGMVNNQMPQYMQGQPQYVQQPQYMQQPGYAQQFPQQYPQQQPQVIVNLQQPPSGQLSAQPRQSEGTHREHSSRGRVSSGPQEWTSGLCDCFDDMGSCCLTCFCPCVQYGNNYEKLHNDGCFTQGFLFCFLMYCCGSCGTCCIHSSLRSNIRQRYHLPDGCGDCLTTCLCPTLAICQEARELQKRG